MLDSSSISDEPIIVSQANNKNQHITLFMGKTKNSLSEKSFYSNDEIILEPVNRFISYEPFINLDNRRGIKHLMLYRIVCENGVYKEKTPSIRLKNDYTTQDYKEAKKLLLEKVNNSLYITKPIKINAKDVIKIDKTQLENFWRYQVQIPKINNPSQLTDIQKQLAYYLGYWLGDGTSASPGNLTIGKEDQHEAEIILEKLAKTLNLTLTMGRGKKGFLCTLTKGKDGLGKKIDASYLEKDWVSNITKACEELDKSKKIPSAYVNFKNNYDPVSKYNKDGNYYCPCYKFNTENIVKKDNREGNLKKNRFILHLKRVHSFDIPNASYTWSSLSQNEQKKYELNKNNKEKITKKYSSVVKNLNCRTLCKYYKIWKADPINGLQNFVDDYLIKINRLLIEFKNLNLINNKHIPEIYLNAPIEVRKQLMAGLIDSDGGSEGGYWSISQCIGHKRLIDDAERLAQSLGYFTRITERISRYTHRRIKHEKSSIRLSITPYNNYDIPLIYKRKRLTGNTTQLPIISHNYETKEIKKEIKKYPPYITYYESKGGFVVGNEYTRKWSIQSKDIEHDVKFNFAKKIANCINNKGIIQGKDDEIERIVRVWNTLKDEKRKSINRINSGKELIRQDILIGYTIKRNTVNGPKFKTFKFKCINKFDSSKILCETLEQCKNLCYLWYDSFDSKENDDKYNKEYNKLQSNVNNLE